jgi:hypothetical protein
MVIKYAAGGAGWMFGGKGKGHAKLYAPKKESESATSHV